MTEPMLTLEQVAERYGVTKVTIGRWHRAGEFPRPVRIGRRLIRWHAAMLDSFDAALQVKAAQQSQPEPVTA